ncbi:MAG: TonB-dependent receptor [Pseudohongiella sp.]|nr:TonB-dependent receptor [Pseudohongiella sp.]MDP2127520.1 TonB-dependent receptor [Pseudohongiella sp.]
MNKTPKLSTLSSALVLLGSIAAVAPAAYAQQGAAPALEEVVVTGSRAAPRTAMDSAAPVDVFSAQDFQDQGTSDINDLMRNLVPTFNVQTQDINDGSSLVRPTTLRGLPADNTLVLINGKRRHRSAVIQYGRAGTHFPDIQMIPPIAMRQVEVLRDGASAQYGSDAIAGVFNFQLKENTEGASFEYKTGQYTETKDGTLQYVAGNVGLALGNDGFASLSFDVTNQMRSDRSIQRADAQAIINAGNRAVPVNAQKQGLPDVSNFNLVANTGIQLSANAELYSFGNYSEKTNELDFFYRPAENRGGLFTSGANHLILDTTGNGTGNCPTIPRSVYPAAGSSLNVLNAVGANPNCFSFLEWFPGGYTPVFGGDIVDMSNVTGMRGEFSNGTRYDVSMNNGFSEVEFFIYNTTNPSMGPASPTSFRPGVYTTVENTLNFDFVTPIAVDGLYSPLSFAYGAEWRREIFEVSNRDDNAWKVGPYATQGANIGSDGFPGFSPTAQGKWDRKNWAFYVDIEADVTERLLLGVAVRYEDFYNTFGDTTEGKLSARYRLTDNMNIRSTYSTGFRAPSPGQANISNISTGVDAGITINQGQIPPTNPISVAFGGKPLTPEQAENFSVGFAWQVGGVDLTVDYYNIKMEDRILNSSNFDITPAIAAQLEASGIVGARSITRFNYYTNDLDTTNQGVEAVASYTYDWGNSSTQFQGSWAWTKQELDSFTPGLLNRAGQLTLTDQIPSNRGNFRANHRMGDWRMTLQANYYDKYLVVPATADPTRDYWAQSEVIFGTEIAYEYNENYTFIIGADNVFSTKPEEVRPIDVGSGTSQRYLTSSGFSPNGRFLYGRVQVNF